MSLHGNSPDPAKDADEIQRRLQMKKFLAGGGKVEQVPIGKVKLSVVMNVQELNELGWRKRGDGDAG